MWSALHTCPINIEVVGSKNPDPKGQALNNPQRGMNCLGPLKEARRSEPLGHLRSMLLSSYFFRYLQPVFRDIRHRFLSILIALSFYYPPLVWASEAMTDFPTRLSSIALASEGCWSLHTLDTAGLSQL